MVRPGAPSDDAPGVGTSRRNQAAVWPARRQRQRAPCAQKPGLDPNDLHANSWFRRSRVIDW
jgi:hypothetical protein